MKKKGSEAMKGCIFVLGTQSSLKLSETHVLPLKHEHHEWGQAQDVNTGQDAMGMSSKGVDVEYPARNDIMPPDRAEDTPNAMLSSDQNCPTSARRSKLENEDPVSNLREHCEAVPVFLRSEFHPRLGDWESSRSSPTLPAPQIKGPGAFPGSGSLMQRVAMRTTAYRGR
ncbi:hypothetical protein SODALDRAFT_358480 [Sodiomyces alkalinus F11]|uniref:Uncharacterized protein n=1 Tax=Sodiomyces alkalinus (strain CBS 110278 / VKM F-3762 / F11) TaxID=1314773 RepID=A0A3N2Q046_SODAK|nr:hypothetical protein SODALDRAFT_358480 [Sodiomyces alkalinus F11]ROT40056.1 hypothetical protein SODALDRAFT_358480 [Sodiomyces alkalinus F11]